MSAYSLGFQSPGSAPLCSLFPQVSALLLAFTGRGPSEEHDRGDKAVTLMQAIEQWDKWGDENEPDEGINDAPDPAEEKRRALRALLRMTLTEAEALEIIADAGDWLDVVISDIGQGYWQGTIKVNGRWISAHPQLLRRRTRLEAFKERQGITDDDQAQDLLLDMAEAQVLRPRRSRLGSIAA